MNKRILTLLTAVTVFFAAAGITAFAVSYAEEPTLITTREGLLAINDTDGNYKLGGDIVLNKNDRIEFFRGTLDGDGHSITVDNNCGLFCYLGGVPGDNPPKTITYVATAVVRNFTVKGTVSGSSQVGGVAAYGAGRIENVRMEADVSSTAQHYVAGIANCAQKAVPLEVINCTFAGTVNFKQGFQSAQNYPYFGIFLGYNGGAFGEGKVVDCKVEYKFAIPEEQKDEITKIEYFNINETLNDTAQNDFNTDPKEISPAEDRKDEITPEAEGGLARYTLECPVNMKSVSIESLNDKGIMANYGAPVVRFTLKDGTYRYIDGFDRKNAKFISDFGERDFDGMYAYEDVSDLEMELKSHKTVGPDDVQSNPGDGKVDVSVSSDYWEVTVNTPADFESVARMINSAVPLVFKNKADGNKKQLSILNSLAVSIKLGDDIDLTEGDANGNPSEFYGLGKQEFFPYRGGLSGGDENDRHTLTVDIDAPDGYAIGIIAVSSEMANDIKFENIILAGSITGNTKVGAVGYFDMVCNNYVKGGNFICKNVTSSMNISGKVGVGGIVGVVSSTNEEVKAYISDCQFTGTVTGNAFVGGFIGCAGFYGKTDVNLTNLAMSGTVTCTNAAVKTVGALVGKVENSGLSENVRSTVTECTVEGTVTSGAAMGECGPLCVDYKTATMPAKMIGNYTGTQTSSLDNARFCIEEEVKKDGKVVGYTYTETEEYNVQIGFSTYAKFPIKVFTNNSADTKKNICCDVKLTVSIYPLNENGDRGAPIVDSVPFDQTHGDGVNFDYGRYDIAVMPSLNEGYYDFTNGYEFTPITARIIAESIDFAQVFDPSSDMFDEQGNMDVTYDGEPTDALEKFLQDTTAAEIMPEDKDKFDWVVEYYAEDDPATPLASAPSAVGRYNVKYRVQLKDEADAGQFAKNYPGYDKQFEATVTIRGRLDIMLDSPEIERGEEVGDWIRSIKFSDKSVAESADDIAYVRGHITVKVLDDTGYNAINDIKILPAGNYDVEAEASSELKEKYKYYDINITSGVLTVSYASSSSGSGSSGSDSSGNNGSGNGGNGGLSTLAYVAIAAAALAAGAGIGIGIAFAVKGKKKQ